MNLLFFYLLLGIVGLAAGFAIIIWRPSPEGGAPGCAIMGVAGALIVFVLVGALLGY